MLEWWEARRKNDGPFGGGVRFSLTWLALAACPGPPVHLYPLLRLCPPRSLPAPLLHRNPAYPHASGLLRAHQYSFALIFLDMCFRYASQILIQSEAKTLNLFVIYLKPNENA